MAIQRGETEGSRETPKFIFRVLTWDQNLNRGARICTSKLSLLSCGPTHQWPIIVSCSVSSCKVVWQVGKTEWNLFLRHKFPFSSPRMRFLGKIPISLGSIITKVWHSQIGRSKCLFQIRVQCKQVPGIHTNFSPHSRDFCEDCFLFVWHNTKISTQWH